MFSKQFQSNINQQQQHPIQQQSINNIIIALNLSTFITFRTDLPTSTSNLQQYPQIISNMIKQRSDYPSYFHALTPRKIIISEFFASLLLSLGAITCSYTPTPEMCLPVVVFWVNVVGCFTGAHTNAMITTSWIFKSHKPFKFDSKTVALYITSQIAGVFAGGLFLKFLFNQIRAPEIVRHEPEWVIRDLFGEILISAIYSCICHIICNKKTTFCESQAVTWIMASFGVYLARQMSPHSGACMNPSMAVGLNLSKSLTSWNLGNFKGLFVYIVGPITGSLVGTLYYDQLYLPRFVGKGEKEQLE